MVILNSDELKKLKNKIIRRNIKTIKIEKKGKRFYCEYDETDSVNINTSNKIADLHELVSDINIDDKSIKEYYLYYDIILDDILLNITKDDSVNSMVEYDNPVSVKIENDMSDLGIDEKYIIKNALNTIRAYFKQNQIQKIKIQNGKRTNNVNIDSVINEMLEIIKNIEKLEE